MFSGFTTTLTLAFSLAQGLNTLYDYDLTSSPRIHTRFDDLDLVLGSHVCHKDKLQTVLFQFLSSVV